MSNPASYKSQMLQDLKGAKQRNNKRKGKDSKGKGEGKPSYTADDPYFGYDWRTGGPVSFSNQGQLGNSMGMTMQNAMSGPSGNSGAMMPMDESLPYNERPSVPQLKPIWQAPDVMQLGAIPQINQVRRFK